MELKYGGKLEFGDLVAVSNGNYLYFGFYAGTGRGTLQYYTLWSVTNAHDRYNDWLISNDEVKAKHWNSKRYSKGFTSKCIGKTYINAVHSTRVMKVTNPETVFTDPKDAEMYQYAKNILIKIGMIKN